MSPVSECRWDTSLDDVPTTTAIATLVAVNQSDESTAAIRFAGALEAGGRIRPRAIAVDDTFPFGGDAIQTERLRALRGRMMDVTPGAATWPVRLAVGNPVPVIVDEAHARGVGLVIMGLRQHPRLDRVMRDETTLNVIRSAEVPVLGVTAWLHHVPRRVVVAVDFGAGSSRAAALACRFVAGGGTLTLAYVDSLRAGASQAGEGTAIIHEGGVEAAFSRVSDSLPLLPGARVETVTLGGSPADALLEYIDRVSADLIVLGRHRHVPVSRAWPGRVTTVIVRDGRCSVLVVPA